MTQTKPAVSNEWRDNWPLVLASSVGFSFFSIMLSGTGLFMQPLEQEFGWSRTMISSGVSIAVIMTALLSPPFGMLVDRYGSRKLALPGIILTTLAISAFGLISGDPMQWNLLWFFFGIVAVSIKSTIWTAAVLGVFTQSKGLALGLTLAGTAVAQMLVPIIGNALIENFGWRAAYVWLGLGWGSVTFVLCLLFFFDAHDDPARKKAKAAGEAMPEKAVLHGLSPQAAWRSTALWRVGISNFVVMVLTMGLGQHLFPILTDAGITRASAALMIGMTGGIAGIVGKLVSGFLLDRYRPNWIGGITLGCAALTFAVLIWAIHSPAMILIAMIVNGYAAGTKTQITGYLTEGYGGMKNFGLIYGVMAAMMALASGLGPLLAGWVFDTYGSYGPFLLAGTIGCTLGGLLIFSLPKYPVWEKETADEVSS